MRQHIVERKGFEATCCKEEPAETGRPGPLLCHDKGQIDSSMKLYNYIKRCGGKLDPGWRSVCCRSPGTSFYYKCYPPPGFKPAHGSCLRVYKSFCDVARAIGVHPLGGRREGQPQKRRRPAHSTPAPHKHQKKLQPPESPDASPYTSVTWDDCLPPEQVANYPGKKDSPSKQGNNDYPGRKGTSINFKSLNALALDAPARGPGHEPRDERRVRGSGIEYYGDSSSAGESSDTDDEGSCGRQGSQREKQQLDVTKEHGRTSESDVLRDGSLAKLLADETLGSDIFESQRATREVEQGREGRMSGGEGAALQHKYLTREAVWIGEEHVPAGHGTCSGQRQPGHISQIPASAGQLPAGQQGNNACDNRPMDTDAPAAKEGKTGAALQRLAAYQGSRTGDISAIVEVGASAHMGAAADAKLRQVNRLSMQAGKSAGLGCVRTGTRSSAASKAGDTDMQLGAELQPAVDNGKAPGGGSAALQQETDEQHEAPAGNREQKATAPQSPHQMASAGKGDGDGSCSQEGRPLVLATPVPKAAAGMPAADPDKSVHHEITSKAEVPQINEPEMGNDKKSNNDCNIDSDSLSGEGVDGLSAFLHHANGSLLADSSSARPDSIVAAYIEEMLAKNHVLRFELAEHRRLLGECSRQLAVKIEQLTERECQLAVTEQHLAKKRWEYSALAAGVEVAIQGSSAKE